MPGSNESCATCFFVEVFTRRLPIANRAVLSTTYTCHWETPSGAPVTKNLWPPVEPTDWCGGWSADGQAKYRVVHPV